MTAARSKVSPYSLQRGVSVLRAESACVLCCAWVEKRLQVWSVATHIDLRQLVLERCAQTSHKRATA